MWQGLQIKVDAEQRKPEDLQKKSDNIERSKRSTATPILPARTEVNITKTIIWYKLVDDNACSPAEQVLIADLRAIGIPVAIPSTNKISVEKKESEKGEKILFFFIIFSILSFFPKRKLY